MFGKDFHLQTYEMFHTLVYHLLRDNDFTGISPSPHGQGQKH